MAGKKNSERYALDQDKNRDDHGTGFTRKGAIKKSGRTSGAAKNTVLDVAGSLGIGLNRYSEMIFNISGISRIDTAGFQMLLKATKDSRESGRFFNFRKAASLPWKISDLCVQKKGIEE